MKYKIPSLKIFHPEKPSRENFLKLIPTGGVIAEIGVHSGGHAREMKRICQPKEFVLVDCWEITDGPINEKRKKEVQSRYEIVLESFTDDTIIKGYSSDVSKTFSDSYFDAVYLDAGHEFEDALNDIKYWFPKVKSDGIICGHDFEFSSIFQSWITPVSGSFCVEEQSTKTGHANGNVVLALFTFSHQNNLEVEIYHQSSRFHDGLFKPIESYEWLIRKDGN